MDPHMLFLLRFLEKLFLLHTFLFNIYDFLIKWIRPTCEWVMNNTVSVICKIACISFFVYDYIIFANANSFLLLILYATSWSAASLVYNIGRTYSSSTCWNFTGLREKEPALYAGLWFGHLICGRMVMVQQVCFSNYTRFLILSTACIVIGAIGFSSHEMSCSERKNDQ